jgi:hypothetical protein
MTLRKVLGTAAIVSTIALSALLTGCSLSPTAPSSGPVLGSSSAITIHGVLHGGQQPVSGAHIYLFAPNTTGYGGNGIAASSLNASLSMLNSSVTTNNPTNSGTDSNGNYYVTTDATGNFSISSDYSCATGYTQSGATSTVLTGSQPVYLYAVGGNPGPSAAANSYAGFMASLGPCSGLGSSTTVFMNEVTTVAMAYAVSGFATDATHISSSGTALALTGINNAFANTTNLVNLTTGNALATTPNGNGTVPQAELYTLANILATCVNSDPSNSSQCSTLTGAATSTGASGGTVPSDTATAAINIAHYPISNVSTLYNLPNGVNAFGGGLTGSTPPNDFTITLAFSGGGLSYAPGNEPHGLAIDGSGNAWSVFTGGSNALSEFSPLGVPANASGYSIGVYGMHSVALDADSSHVWIANVANSSVVEFTISGATSATYTPSGIYEPLDVELDGSGNAWVSDSSSNGVLKLNSSGVLQGSAIQGNGLLEPVSIAIEPGAAGNVWLSNLHASDVSVFTNSGTALYDDTNGGVADAAGSAIDSTGNIWFANTSNQNVSKLSSDGSSGSSFSVGASVKDALAIDGAGNVWITDNNTKNALFELNNSGTSLSGNNGFVPAYGAPDALAIDGSGDVWYSDVASPPRLLEVIGAAVPVVTPIAYGVANSMLGTRP